MGWLQPIRNCDHGNDPSQERYAKRQCIQLAKCLKDNFDEIRASNVTDLRRKANKVIAEYDKRADVENFVLKAKREELDAIP